MKVALIGYGKMGREIDRLMQAKGHSILVRVDPNGGDTEPEIVPERLGGVDICIDFSHPQAVLNNIRTLVSAGKPLVVGTTGWHEHLAEVKGLVERSGVGFVHAANFSVGVNLFYLLAERAAQLFGRFDDYDVFGLEVHHRHKIDSPSGTAKRLSQIILGHFAGKKRVVSDSLNRAIEPDEFHLLSVRSGEFPGKHALVFDSVADTIEISHAARSRAGFAVGAIMAAEWVLNRRGFYSFEEVIGDLLESRSGR
ncbi:MAG: 4-hydroxy-tetrahydrodipicolinate reductase [Acidobacteriota bacterium]